MNIESNITVNGLQVKVQRKSIKNLHLGVYPPSGRVRMAVPLAVSDGAVRRAVIGKLGWIKRQQKRFRDQPRQSKREMISGESHYFLGGRYRLKVIHVDTKSKIILKNKANLELYTSVGSRVEEREQVLYSWYRQRLKEMIPPLLDQWQRRIGVAVPFWGVKRMKTKWGSCNVATRRIWLNLELTKKPQHCLEYILVHELVHLLERHHNERFVGLMDKFLPRWRFYKEELNCFPLSHSEWQY